MARGSGWTFLAVLAGVSPLLVLVHEYRDLTKRVTWETIRATTLSDKGETLAHQGDLQAARSNYEQALALSPGHSLTLLRMADLRLAEHDLAGAESYGRQAVASDPRLGEGYNTLGVIAAMRGEMPRAIEYFQKTLELMPNHAMARENLARARQQVASHGSSASVSGPAP